MLSLLFRWRSSKGDATRRGEAEVGVEVGVALLEGQEEEQGEVVAERIEEGWRLGGGG